MCCLQICSGEEKAGLMTTSTLMHVNKAVIEWKAVARYKYYHAVSFV